VTHKVQLHDDRAAFDLLGAVVRQCRKDIVQKGVDAADRADAFEFFLTLGGFGYEANDGGTSSAGGEEIQFAACQVSNRGGTLGAYQGAASAGWAA